MRKIILIIDNHVEIPMYLRRDHKRVLTAYILKKVMGHRQTDIINEIKCSKSYLFMANKSVTNMLETDAWYRRFFTETLTTLTEKTGDAVFCDFKLPKTVKCIESLHRYQMEADRLKAIREMQL